MTTVHVIRGLYMLVSIAVVLAAIWRGQKALNRDGIAAFAFAAYAASTAAAQGYAFNRPLTVGTLYVGVGVIGGAAWLAAVAVDYARGKR